MADRQPAKHDRDRDAARTAIAAGRPVAVSTAPRDVVQRQGAAEAAHAGTSPTPAGYIEEHSGLFGLDETGLGADLFVLAWQSDRHYDFVVRVLDALDAEDRRQVATALFEHVRTDSPLEDMALSSEGRTFLSSVAGFLPERSAQRRRVAGIVAAGPQRERERERVAAQEALKEAGGTADVTFFPEYESMDVAERELAKIAKRREESGRTDAAFGVEEFDLIGEYLATIAEQSGRTGFVRRLVLMGHGRENAFGFGEHMYTGDYLRDNYGTGQFAAFVADGATIHLQGCAVAKGEAGRDYLGQVGRIFFGEDKTGYLKGNACNIVAIGELTECEPRTLRWPNDFE